MEMNPGLTPKIYQYDQYRDFLKVWLEWKKKNNSSYSSSVFSKRAGISSHTLLGMVIRGDRNLSYKTIRGFCKALELSAQEALYFEKLVQFNQSGSSDDKAYFLEQLMSVSNSEKNSKLKTIQNYAQYLSFWYIVVIREMVHLSDFKPDFDWMSKKLKGKISKSQAEKAWNILLELGMVLKNQQGMWTVVDPYLDIDPGHADFAIRNFHKDFLERTKEAIDEEALEDRELSSLTFAISTKDLEDLKLEIKNFRKNLNLKYPNKNQNKNLNLKRELVVSVNMQLMKLTKEEDKRSKQR